MSLLAPMDLLTYIVYMCSVCIIYVYIHLYSPEWLGKPDMIEVCSC